MDEKEKLELILNMITKNGFIDGMSKELIEELFIYTKRYLNNTIRPTLVKEIKRIDNLNSEK
jgi:hypothetical protein